MTANPVTVVGAGPVGLTAALALRSFGLPVWVLEADPSDRVRPGSRALFVHRESLRLLDIAHPGLADDLVGHGVVWRTRRTLHRGHEVYAKTYPATPAGELPPFTSLRQVETEKHLLAAAKQAGVEFRWGTPVTDVAVSGTDVALRTGDGEVLRSEYVVAADGARSVVRERSGLELRGSRTAGFHVVVDIADPGADETCLERTFHYEHPAIGGRNVLRVPFAGGFQIDLQCRDDDDPDDFATDAAVRRWLPSVVDERYLDQILWVSKYQYRQVVADSFVDPRHRVLLAGEAAHLFPPLGARGMNSGIADSDAAATAVAAALSATNPARASEAVQRFGADRRAAALHNRDAVRAALAHVKPPTPLGRARRRVAGALAPAVPAFGRWLEHAAYGPRTPAAAHGTY